MIPQPATRDLATTGPLPETSGGSRGTNRWGALAAICLATFVVVTDFMAVSVALPVVQTDLSASFPQIQWVMEAFVVALTCCVLAAGYVAGRAGPRRVFLAGLAVLSCGSVLAGAAPSVYVLIGARAVQGVGAAMLLATGAVILAEVFGGTDGRIGPGVGVGVWGTATGTALALSPLLGGVIATYLGWRWLFGVAAIASCVALLVGLVTVPSFSGPSLSGPSPSGGAAAATGSDWRGLALFTAGTAVLVVGLVRTTTTLGSWAQSGVLACLACSGLLLAAFVAVESVSPSPVLDVSLFRRRTFAGSAVAAFGLSMAVLGPFIFLVLYLSYNLGYSTLSIGSHLLFLSGMTLVLLPLAGLFDRHIPVKVIICAGLALVGAGLWLMSRLATNATWADLVPGLIVAGVGLELVNPRLALTAAAAAPPGERSILSAARASTALRQLGAATGVAVFGSVFATRLSDEISSRILTFPQLSGQGSQIAGLVLDGRTGAAINSAPAPARPALYAVIHTSFTGTMHDVFLVAAGVAAVSAVLALSIRSSDVRRQATAHEADVVPAPAALSAGERPRAQLGPGEPLRPEVEPAGLEPALVVLEPRLGEDVPGQEIISLDPASIDITSHLFPPVGPTADELVTVKRSADGAGATGRRNGAPGSGDQEPNSEEHAARRRDAGDQDATPPALVDDARDEAGSPYEEVASYDAGWGREEAGALEPSGPGPMTVPSGSLTVKVTRARNGSPLKAELTLLSPQTDVVLRHWTDGNAELVVPALAAGDYDLVVQSLGYRAETVPVPVTAGATRAVEVALVGLAHIYGAVTGPGGGWLPGVLVTLTDGSGAVVATTNSDDAGSFHFARVPEGSYTVAAPAWAVANSDVDITPGSVVVADVVFSSSRDEDGGTVL